MTDTNPYEIFISECPDIARAFDGLVDAQRNAPGMDNKTKQLVNIALRLQHGIRVESIFTPLWQETQEPQKKRLRVLL